MKNTAFLFLLFCLIVWSLPAQKVDIKRLEGLKIRNIGPAGMSGRVTAIDVNLSNPDIIFIGTASGGVWKSQSGGIRWEPVFDEAPVQAIGALKINQQNPSEIWVGTGEGNPRNSHNSGEGIYKSIDGGKTWKLMGLEKTRLIHRIIIHRDNPNIVFVGAMGSAWGPSEDRGVYRTTDGGKSWKKVLYINKETGVGDMVTDPTNPNKLIASMWEFGRKPWFFNSGGKGSGLHISYDAGDSWTQITDEEGLPKGELGRIGLAIAASKPNIVYALVEAKKNGLYKSVDGGHEWKLVSEKNIGNRPFYYAELYVDSKNENRLWNLWSYVSKSEDGGKTFKTILDYGKRVHPDHHAFWIHPDKPDYIIDGNDGGLNISRDGGANWEFIDNLPLAQFYHINHDMDIPYHVLGGMQDNGSWVGPSSVWKNGSIRNADWQEVMFGDGFDVMLRRDDNRYGWAMSQGGNLGYFDRQTGKNLFIKPVHPDSVELRFNWNAALAQNPFHDCGIYYGSQFVHKSMNCGQSWEIISPDLTSNDTTKQKQASSGGLTLDVTNAENFTTLLAITPSPLDEQLIWVGTDDGNVQLTRDGGKHWENLASRLPGLPKGSWIPQIVASEKNAAEAFVVANDYRRNNYKPYLYHTKDYGQTWRRLADEHKVKGHALSVAQDAEVPDLLFLGTDYGLYISFDGGGHWQQWSNDFPSVSTSDLKIHPREHDLIVGTFGRAAWILDDIEPLREIARTKAKVLTTPFKVFAMSHAYLASYRSVDGSRFGADGDFVGKNGPRAALITAWVREKAKEKKNVEEKSKKKTEAKGKAKEAKDKKPGGPKSKKVKVQVFDNQGDTLYTFYHKLKDGMNRFGWNLRRKGPRFPSRAEVKPEQSDPWGPRVLPGKYKLVFTYGDFKDSTTVEVKADPRQQANLADWRARARAQDNFSRLVDKATQGFDQLKDAKKTIGRVDKLMETVADSSKKEITKAGKAMRDSINQLMDLYMQPEDTKGIIRTSDKLNSVLWRARNYINNSPGAPNQMARRATEKAKEKVVEVLEQINRFFTHSWSDYQKQVEAVRYQLFEDFEPVKLE